MTVFEEQYATIWEHLAELRDTLLKIALVILAGFLGALLFY